MTMLRAELFSGGAPLNAGNLETILACQYGSGLGKIGAFSIQVPAEDINSGTVSAGQEIRIYREGEGLVFRGVVDHTETLVQENGALILTISGQGIEVQLARATTQTGLTLNAVTLASAVSSALAVPALTGTGWTAGALDTPLTAYTQIALAPVWPVLQSFADTFNCYLRADNLNKRVDIGAFGTNPNGIEFRNVEEIGVGLDSNPRLFPIQRIRIIGDSTNVITRIIPLGQQTGINNVDFDISLATVTSPYTKASLTGPDGQTVWYIEDVAATASTGGGVPREVTRRYKGVSPLGLTATDFQNAANQLIQNAGADLARESQVLRSYEVVVTGLKHIINGQPTFRVGETILVVYRGITTDLTGKRKWIDVDAQLYVMEFTRTFAADGSDAWTFVVSTVRRPLPTDGNVTAAMLEQIQGVQSAPSPYVLLNPSIRVDKYGMQLALGGSIVPSIFFLQNLVDSPSTSYPQGTIGGYATATIAGLQTGINAGTNHAISETFSANTTNAQSWTLTGQNGTDIAQVSMTFNSPGWLFGIGAGCSLYLGSVTADPTNLVDGMVWYRSDLGKLFARINGVTVSLGGGGMKVQGSGYLVMPAAAASISPASSGGAWTSGAYSQVVASTSEADYLFGAMVLPDSSAVFHEFELDIATGGAGSETVVSTFSISGAGTSISPNGIYISLPAPIAVATATRIAIRQRSDSGTLRLLGVKLVYCKQTDLVSL